MQLNPRKRERKSFLPTHAGGARTYQSFPHMVGGSRDEISRRRMEIIRELLKVAIRQNQRAAKALIDGNERAYQHHTETALAYIHTANKEEKNGHSQT